MRRILNRWTVVWMLAAACAGPSRAEDAANYPNRPITLVVPTAAAGGTDTIARLFAEVLTKSLGQPVVVDNRPGANGILGIENVAKSAPDGYRLLLTYAASMAVNPSLYKKLPFDPIKDFAPIAQIGRGGNLLLVRQDFPATTLQGFIDQVKAHPGQFNYCSWGNGSGGHLAMESLKKQAGLDIAHVPYKGSSGCVQDLIGGQIDAGFADVSSTVEIVRAGRLRAVAYGGADRLASLPDVPTLTETGHPFRNYAWYGLFAPARTPPAIVERLSAEMTRALRDPAVIRRLNELNLTDLPVVTPAQFGATLQQDIKDWASLVKEVGVTLN